MKTSDEITSSIREQVLAAKNICIISHRNPDGDTLGSNLAMRLFLEKKGKKVTSACVDDPELDFDFLASRRSFVKDFRPEDFDLFICVDCASAEQAFFPVKYPEILKDKKLVNIDHHASNKLFGTHNLIAENSPSTTLVVFNLFKAWGEKISGEIATCLLLGLYSDTGSFMHSNASAEAFEAAAELISLGAKRRLIIEKLYKQHSIEKLRLLGKILSEAQITGKNVIVSAVKQEDFEQTNACQADLNGAIDFINMAKGSRLAALLSEDGQGNVRGSLRTKNDNLNLSEIAVNLGGGGHKKASGFTIKGKLKKVVRWSVTDAIDAPPNI